MISLSVEQQEWKVLIEVTTTEGTPSVEAWMQWLRSDMPCGVGKIELQAAYRDASCVLSITLLIEVWDLLPDRGSHIFVTYVTSGNTLLPALLPSSNSSMIMERN
jgi:hypothetical protein